MLQWIARLAIAAPRRIVAAAVLAMVAVGIFGIPVTEHLSAGGFQDPASESAQAAQLLAGKFNQGDVAMLVTVSSDQGAQSPAARAAALGVVNQLRHSPHVAAVNSFWTAPPPAAKALVSRDGKSGLIVAGVTGGENEFAEHALALAGQIGTGHDGVTVRSGGAVLFGQANEQTKRDLVLMESVAVPLSFLVLVWIFGGLVAAALPVMVGIFAILGSMSVLRAITSFTDVSLFALNLSIALGLALAIDYTLLIISRYRDEVAGGLGREEALIRTMSTAGRTVLFSAMTVALSMVTMVLFPMYFLKSFAYAGVAVVAFAVSAAIVVTPAAIALLGDRLDSLDVRRLVRRVLKRPEPVPRPVEQMFWYRSTKFVMRRAIPVMAVIVTFLLLLGAPFLGVRWGYLDDRVLPTSASSRQVGDALRHDFTVNPATQLNVVIPDIVGLNPVDIDHYAERLSRVPDVSMVSAPGGTFIGGRLTGPPTAATGTVDGSAFMTIDTTTEMFSDAAAVQIDRLHQVPGPGDRQVLFGGIAVTSQDAVNSITSRLALVLGAIAVITFVLLFMLTGSVVLPLKALVLNVLSLTAAFGALVWIFQDGHLGGLGTTATGTLVANVPVLLFCIAFGLSMDYEVFVISRIREYWLASGQTRADNDESVALGLARTGRVVTAAAVIMSISFAALIAAKVSFMRMFGLGLTLAVLVDATVIRMLLLPAFMHVLGRANWWAPKPLVKLHRRIGISESDSEPADRPAAETPL
jgi:RND superfamily putative drug exporter